MNIKATFNKIINGLFNTRAAGLYIALFAISIGVATFIENDFGTSAAQKLIFRSWWFELLLFLFAGTLLVNIVKFRMIQLKKWALLIFHAAMIIILIGAAITRFYGYEGIMHIRENDSSNTILSSETFLQFEVIKDGNKYRFDEPVLFASLGKNKFDESYQIGNDIIEFKVKDFIPNPIQVLEDDPNGLPTIKIVFAGMNGRQEYFLSKTQMEQINGVNFNFSDIPREGAVNINWKDGELTFQTDEVYTQRVMATQRLDTLYPETSPHPLMLRSLYSNGTNSFVFGDFKPAAKSFIKSDGIKVRNESNTAIVADLIINGDSREVMIYGKKGLPGRPAITRIGNVSTAISYGAKPIQLPFSIRLYDFIMERYPGTNSAASYASEVQLVDPRNNHTEDFRIFMNNILTYNGFRFFQSSFDQDELGTYLSVNHDFWGTWISYLGYALLTVGLIMTFFSKNTRFAQVSQKLARIHNKATLIFIIIMGASFLNGVAAQKKISQVTHVVDKDHAKLFSSVVVQDHKGRMKPMQTLSRELLRKVSRKESFEGLNADQVILGMYVNREDWLSIPFIKVSENEELQARLEINSDYASYKDFFNKDGSYKLMEEVRRAYGLQPIDRGTTEKEIMKVDERVNIVNMIFSGAFFRIIPNPGDENNEWVSARHDHGNNSAYPEVAEKFFSAYPSSLRSSMDDGDYTLTNQIIVELKGYQERAGGEVMPSNSKINAELLLNKMKVFGRLAGYYPLLGLGFLVLLFLSVFKEHGQYKQPFQILFYLVVLGFIFHTIGLGMRWYVSGRAPWSNGYETMIYIAWTTTLAGLLFTKRSIGGMAAMMILSGTILLVAMLSYLDPEITPLVPVLKSYWLTIHVSLIAGSYGFLMLGAIIGLMNLILLIFLKQQNKRRIKSVVQELSYISELTMMGGLVMLSIGTYLGGVWANESWGRYWGWDAKETWALVTILVYAFILHMRIIPKLGGLYAFNLATLFGWASVIMTYFGVNYYLSGLHSYAAGDPVPIPMWVYISVASVTLISILAYWRKEKVGFS